MAAQAKKNRRQINLLPQEEFAASTPGRVLHWLLSTFRYLVIATEMIVICAFLSRFYFDSRLADLSDEIKQKESYIKAYSEFEQEFRLAQNKLSVFGAMADDKNKLSPLIENMIAKLPADVSIIQLALMPDNILQIQAASVNERSIEQFIVNLSDYKSLSELTLVQADSKAGTPFITFTLRATIVKGGSQ